MKSRRRRCPKCKGIVHPARTRCARCGARSYWWGDEPRMLYWTVGLALSVGVVLPYIASLLAAGMAKVDTGNGYHQNVVSGRFKGER